MKKSILTKKGRNIVSYASEMQAKTLLYTSKNKKSELVSSVCSSSPSVKNAYHSTKDLVSNKTRATESTNNSIKKERGLETIDTPEELHFFFVTANLKAKRISSAFDK